MRNHNCQKYPDQSKKFLLMCLSCLKHLFVILNKLLLAGELVILVVGILRWVRVRLG